MSVHNTDIAAAFEEIADLLEVQAANPFRIRAYRNAARQLRALSTPVAELVRRGADLTALPAIGPDLAAKIVEFVTTGHCAALDELHHELPASLAALLALPGLGPKRVRTLHEALHIDDMRSLAAAARDGRVRALPGFGPKTEAAILAAVAARSGQARRFLLSTVTTYAEALRDYLDTLPEVTKVVIAGSYRRRRETVGDLDVLVTTRAPAKVIRRFVAYDEVRQVLAQGDTRATVVLASGLQVDLRVVAHASYGAALQYFTGSKAHNIELRRLAQARGLKINEYGVFRGSRRIAGASEEAVYATLDLPWIPPELREAQGEFAAARASRLPRLIERRDLRGDLHVHTAATDGQHSLREMADAARAAGLAYLAITDHSRHLKVAHGLDTAALRRQMREIDRLNATLSGIRLLKGIEVDILEDGRLDLPAQILSDLDVVIGAVHSGFKLSRAAQTARLVRALADPNLTILAHPTGRLLNTRDAYEVDMLAVMRAAAEHGRALEINAHPQRLDLNDVHCRMARDHRVSLVIDSDAHRIDDFANLEFGIGQARRGWLTKADVLNSLPLTRLLARLRPATVRTARRPR